MFFCVCWRNTRYLFVRIGGYENEKNETKERVLGWASHSEKKERKQFIRKVSLWFNKSPKLKMLFAFILVFHRCCLFFLVSRKNARQKNEWRRRKHKSFMRNHSIVFPQLLHLCELKASLLFFCCSLFSRKDKSLLRLIMKDEKFFLLLSIDGKTRENPGKSVQWT